MNHLELLKKLLLALEEHTQDYSPVAYLYAQGALTKEEFQELDRLEGVAWCERRTEVPND